MNKEEKKEYDRQYYLKNREKILARTEKYNKANRDLARKAALRYYNSHKEKVKEYQNSNPEIIKKCKQNYVATHKEEISKYGKEYSKNNRVKKNVQNKVYRAKKQGKIIIPIKCEKCGKTRKLEAHHYDYSKPLDVVYLCNSCHQKEHLNIEGAR